MMTEIQIKYRKRKSIYFSLVAILFGIIISFRFVEPATNHKASPIEWFMIVCLIGVAISIYAVFRCPKCNASLVPNFSTLWGKIQYCPKCGVELIEGKQIVEK